MSRDTVRPQEWFGGMKGHGAGRVGNNAYQDRPATRVICGKSEDFFVLRLVR